MKNTLSKMQIIELAENIQVPDLDAFNYTQNYMQNICAKEKELNITHEIYNMNDSKNNSKIDMSEVQQFLQLNSKGVIIFTIIDKFNAFAGLVFCLIDNKIKVIYVDPNLKSAPEQIKQQLYALGICDSYIDYYFRVIGTEQQNSYVDCVSAQCLVTHYECIIKDIKKYQAQLKVSQTQSESLEEYKELPEEYEEYDGFEVVISLSELNNEYYKNVVLNTTKLQPKNTTNFYTFGKGLFKKPDGNSTIGTLISLSSEADASWYQQYLLWRDTHKYVF